MEERELTPTEIEIRRKEIFDQIRRDENIDRKVKASMRGIPNKRIHSVRKLKKALRRYHCYPYMIYMVTHYLKMLSCATSYIRHSKAKCHGDCHESVERLHISFYETMLEHYTIKLS